MRAWSCLLSVVAVLAEGCGPGASCGDTRVVEDGRCVCAPGLVLVDPALPCVPLDAGVTDADVDSIVDGCVVAAESCDGVDNDCDTMIDETPSELCEVTSGATAARCEAGRCVLDCEDGLADCNLDPSDGCEADQTDPDEACAMCERECAWSCEPGGCSDLDSLEADGATSCGISENGASHCWGSNDNGSIGDGTRENRNSPTRQLGLGQASAIDVGETHACAVVDGLVFCWGGNGGRQLGNGGALTRSLVPVMVINLTDAEDLALGGNHSCAIRRTRQPMCWGANSFGQLGIGSVGVFDEPTIVPLLTNVETMAAGKNHTCAVTPDGVFCFGDNRRSQLGIDSDDATRDIPSQVVGIATATDLSLGVNHSCAVVASRVHCWGANDVGQQGMGTTGDDERSPQRVDGLTNVIDVECAGSHACALRTNGEVWCWGENSSGQVGSGGDVVSVPQQVDVEDVVDIAVGVAHSCAQDSSGRVFCWGAGTQGELGAGDDISTPIPVEVQAP